VVHTTDPAVIRNLPGGGGFRRGGGPGGGPGGIGMVAIDICTSKDRSNSGIRRL